VSAVLVTGGGTGIGAAVARLLREAGDEVAILGRRPEALAAVAASTGALDVVCDVSDAGQVSGAIAVVVERFGRLDGLVLNAGVMVPGGISELSLDDWDALVSVNLTGAFYVARAALPALLRARGGGRVGGVGGRAAGFGRDGRVRGDQGGAGDAHPVAGRRPCAPGLRANVVCPGWTVTEMADSEMAAFGAPRGLGVRQAYAHVTSLVPARRPASAAEVAAVVAWLLSDASSYVNGAVIPVDGAGIAVDVGTLPFDPRVEVRPDEAP